MLKVPSGFCSHPSKIGATFWPLAYWTWAATRRPAAQTIASATHAAQYPLMGLLRRRHSSLFCLSFLHLLPVLFVCQIVVAHPSSAHFVDGPLPVGDRVVRVRVELVMRRVVIPRREVQDGARRQQRLLVFVVEIHDVPGELVVTHTTQRLDFVTSRVDGLHTRGFAAVMQVGLE